MHKKALLGAASALLLSLGGVIAPRTAEAAAPYNCSSTILSVLPPTVIVGLDTPGALYACITTLGVQNDVIAYYRVLGGNPGATVGTQGVVAFSAGFNVTLPPSSITLTICVGTDPTNPATWTCVPL